MLLIVALAAPAVTLVLACRDNMFTGSLTPVPPVHRLPPDVAGAVILLDADPVIETKDPNHVLRANEQGVPRGYREAMVKALELGGFKVTAKPSDPHNLVARLAIAVSEDGENVRQVYRCGLVAPGAGSTAIVANRLVLAEGHLRRHAFGLRLRDPQRGDRGRDLAPGPRLPA